MCPGAPSKLYPGSQPPNSPPRSLVPVLNSSEGAEAGALLSQSRGCKERPWLEPWAKGIHLLQIHSIHRHLQTLTMVEVPGQAARREQDVPSECPPRSLTWACVWLGGTCIPTLQGMTV